MLEIPVRCRSRARTAAVRLPMFRRVDVSLRPQCSNDETGPAPPDARLAVAIAATVPSQFPSLESSLANASGTPADRRCGLARASVTANAPSWKPDDPASRPSAAVDANSWQIQAVGLRSAKGRGSASCVGRKTMGLPRAFRRCVRRCPCCTGSWACAGDRVSDCTARRSGAPV